MQCAYIVYHVMVLHSLTRTVHGQHTWYAGAEPCGQCRVQMWAAAAGATKRTAGEQLSCEICYLVTAPVQRTFRTHVPIGGQAEEEREEVLGANKTSARAGVLLCCTVLCCPAPNRPPVHCLLIGMDCEAHRCRGRAR